MDQLAPQPDRTQTGVGEVDPQNRVVLLHIRAQQQQRSAVQAQFQPREIPCVVMVDAVGTAISRGYVATTVEYRECVTVLEGAQAPLLKRDVGVDVKRGCASFAVIRGSRLDATDIVGWIRQLAQPTEPQ